MSTIAPPATSCHRVSTEDDHVAGAEDRLERADGAAPVAQVGMVLQQVIGGEIELHVHGAVLEPTAVDQADVAEHALHTDVVRERLRHQPPEPGLAGDAGEILEQHRGDALLVMGVGHGERHLRLFTARRGRSTRRWRSARRWHRPPASRDR